MAKRRGKRPSSSANRLIGRDKRNHLVNMTVAALKTGASRWSLESVCRRALIRDTLASYPDADYAVVETEADNILREAQIIIGSVRPAPDDRRERPTECLICGGPIDPQHFPYCSYSHAVTVVEFTAAGARKFLPRDKRAA